MPFHAPPMASQDKPGEPPFGHANSVTPKWTRRPRRVRPAAWTPRLNGGGRNLFPASVICQWCLQFYDKVESVKSGRGLLGMFPRRVGHPLKVRPIQFMFEHDDEPLRDIPLDGVVVGQPKAVHDDAWTVFRANFSIAASVLLCFIAACRARSVSSRVPAI